jgi:MFS family permease
MSVQLKSKSFLGNIRSFSLGIWLYLMAWFVLQFSFAGIYSVLLNLFLRRLGYSEEFMGLVLGSSALGFALFAIPAGGFGARWGYKKMIMTGMISGTICTFLLPFAQYMNPDISKIIIVGSYGLFAVSMTLIAVNGIPFLASSASDESRVHVFSAYGAMAPLAGFFGSIVGGFLPKAISDITSISLEKPEPYAFSMWIVPVFLLAFTCLFLFFIKEKHGPENAGTPDSQPEKAPIYLFITFFIFTVFRIATFWSIFAFFSIYLDSSFKIPVAVIGILTAIGRIIPAFTALFTPALAKRIGKFNLIVMVSVVSTIMALPMGLIPSVVAAAISLIAISGLNAIDASIFSTFQQEVTPEKWRSLMSGFCFAAEAVSYTLVAYAGGFMIQSLGYQPFFLSTTAATFISAFIFWFAFRKKYGKC